ncbi:MAG: endonuclease/exonuclease/phosphatase family protein [Anaerolineae bacterium]|nr:endonuclease/exonuclease/phosphatase family protein [Anaerolineae bacterium]
MEIKVGTFNLNNLFSRFNFTGEIDALQDGDHDVTVTYTFDDPSNYTIRTFQGRLVKEKPAAERAQIARRILAMDVDVLAVQEVEDVAILNRFAIDDLGSRYPYRVLVEGNDPRLIDVGILSKLPIGGVTSWRFAVHPDDPIVPVFSRDLLEVEVLDAARRKRLFTLYNNHLKSQYVPFGEDPVAGTQQADLRRKRQAEIVASIVEARMRPDSAFIVVGDMNDASDAPTLAPLVGSAGLGLVNALAQPQETRPAKADNPPPPSKAWTHRFKEQGKPAHYELFDQIWLSPALANKQTAAWIDRRTRHSGDGSDHDPAWVHLAL